MEDSMADDRTEMLGGARRLVTLQIEKKLGARMAGAVWGSRSLNLRTGEHGLVIHRGSEKRVFTFTEAELTDGYGSPKWRSHLLARVNESVRKMDA
jgi:hypothetical protein